MAYNYQPIDVADFSGGETDNYINASVNRSQFLENLYVNDTKKPITRWGTQIDDDTNTPQISLGSQRISRLISFDGTLFNLALNQLSRRNPTNYAELQGPAGGSAFLDSDELNDHAHTKWGKLLFMTSSAFDKPIKVYKDDTGVFRLRTAGLPATVTPVCTPTAGAFSYIYGFFYKYTYNVGDQEFVDFGPVTLVQVSSAAAPNVSLIAITAYTALSNAAGDNYDTATVEKVVARSANGGGVLYIVTAIANATTTYNDTMSDATLQTGAAIYTTGDIPDNDPPPLAKFCHTVGGLTYYGHIKVGTEIFPSTFRQSQADDPDSVPESFEGILEDEIVGISSVYGKPIFGCTDYIYAIEGSYDEVGRGSPTPNRISDSAGLVSHSSFVQTEKGLFWCGADGFYWTDGQAVKKVSRHLNARYKARLATLRERSYRIQGKYDPTNDLIFWTFSDTALAVEEEECNILWVCDLKFGVSDEMTFYTWLGGDSFLPSSIEVFEKSLYRGDHYGFVLKFSPDYITDPKIDADDDADTWPDETIMWRYRSTASNFGTSGVRKVANKLLISAKNETNISIKITALNDDSKLTRVFEPIRWRKNFTWGDDEFYCDNPDFVWYYGGLIEQDRRFPARGMRFNYLQIQIENDFSNVLNSNSIGEATANASTKVVTLVDAVDFSWPTQSIDYVIYFEFDSYMTGFTVLARTASTITVADPDNLLQAGTWEWQLKGYKKGEILSLNEYSISWALASRSHDVFNRADRGSVSE